MGIGGIWPHDLWAAHLEIGWKMFHLCSARKEHHHVGLQAIDTKPRHTIPAHSTLAMGLYMIAPFVMLDIVP
jgi:hypothetical protein